MKFKDDIHVGSSVGGSMCMRHNDDIKVGSNVRLRLIDKSGTVVEERVGHNIFLDYGREWLSELIAYQSYGPDTPFRTDIIKYMAFGIGGTSQLVSSSTIRATWPLFPDGAGTGDPSQTDTNPAVNGLEWPVVVTTNNYFNLISAPATYPTAGTVRFTSVLGYNEVSFGAYTSVPLSEIALCTESVEGVLSTAPTTSAVDERYIVAYHTFDTLSKTSAFILQMDWELRFA